MPCNTVEDHRAGIVTSERRSRKRPDHYGIGRAGDFRYDAPREGMRVPRLTLSLLGPPRVEVDGRPVEVDTRKAIALLMYLAVTGEAHRRDSLATLLWPEYDQESARASLRRTLSALKKGLGGAWLEIQREQIGLQGGPEVSSDVDLFRARLTQTRTHGHSGMEVCAACIPLLSEAAELYRGELAAGFSLRDSPAFDDWQLFEADALRRDAASTLERLAGAMAAQGAWQQAIGYAQRWLAFDPLHEAAHRLLMQVFASCGDRTAALRQYRDCVRVLEKELGVTPLGATTALAEAIKEDRTAPLVGGQAEPPPAARSGHAAPSSTTADPRRMHLVGRAAELDALQRAYAGIHLDGHLAAVEGEAGIGKTRLAEELLESLRAKGAAVMVATCHSGEKGLAYAPFVQAVRNALAQSNGAVRLSNAPDHWLVESARLVPELAAVHHGLAQAPPLENPGAQGRFFEGLSQVLLALLTSSAPGVLFVDDAHWADEASLDLLAYLARRLEGRPVLLLVTWRTELVPPDHRLRRLVSDARRIGRATLLLLARLDRVEVRELVRLASPTDVGELEAFAATLSEETEGLPFFIVEYLAAAADAPSHGTLPAVRDLLRSRLAEISQTGRQLLTTAATVGRSFDLTTLREVSGRGEDETVAALDELIARGLMREVGIGGSDASYPGTTLAFDFTHQRMRELVYEETTLVRRRLLHRRTAEALRARARVANQTGALAAQIAWHLQLAGHDAEAAEQFYEAALHARRVHANAEALLHFRSALALGHVDAAGLHEAIGDLQTLAGDYAAALGSYEVAAAVGNSKDLSRIEHKLGDVYRRRGEWDLAESHFAAAQTGFGHQAVPGERARLYADWSLVAHRRGRSAQAERLAHEALGLAEADGDVRARAQSHNILGILAASTGEAEQARHHQEQGLALAETLTESSARISALNNLALAYGASGALEQAVELAERALALCVIQGDRHHEAALHSNLADLLHAAGRSDAAIAHLKQAAPIFAEIGARHGDFQPEIWKMTVW
jgi:DNA-binding SARP family transcriptional activator/predicted ATPase